ncbi:MAG TPA: hypothetical protein VGN72_19540 [Tepidisphaeraceae bacterium]|jgi:hypothetical protein|nr:hypothetical protein [Tepidisphaeraceae bacterium]
MKHLSRLIAAAFVTTGAMAWAQQGGDTGTQDALAKLDADGNGLYDDAERKALLDVLQKQYPTELAGTFDHDGDGKVTIPEQTQGRHPLSTVIPKTFPQSDVKIPWGIDMFPEWISTAYLQEDLEPGEVKEHAPRGLFTKHNATPVNDSKLPKRAADRGGIEFAANSGQQLTMPGARDARWNYRWCVLTFKVDSGTGTDAETLLLDLNTGNGPARSSPKVWFHMDTGLHVQFVGSNKSGLDKRVMVAENVLADGKTWNVLVCGMRYGQMFASVNGVELKTQSPQPPRFSTARPDVPAEELNSYLGDPGQGAMAWAYDSLIFGLTEPSEAMVRKMTGWAAHRLGFQESLPADHPYRSARPVMDAEDLPDRYVHDEAKWLVLGEKVKDKSVTRVNAGGPRVDPKGFERVFHDDFRANRLGDSRNGDGDLWVGPGFNTAVGVDSPLIPPGQEPNAYPYDEKNQKQTVALVDEGNGRWRAGALYTVNDMGYGYTWKGPKVFRIRCMFPKSTQADLTGGLFPAFWSYDPDFLFWRTANRTEVDYFEFDGQNGNWLNGLSTHHHYSHLRENIFAKNPGTYKRFKVYGGELTEEKSNIPGGIFLWDGQYHTWEFVFDRDMTYINVTIPGPDGKDRWVEICRAPTAPTYLNNLDLQFNMALKARYGKPTSREDYTVDFIEVLQKSEDLQTVPAPFTAKPTLSGSSAAGSTITCEPNLKGVTDVRYYWFADGYPLTYSPSNTYKITAAEAGKEIRCMVRAVGALDKPEAWSEPLK